MRSGCSSSGRTRTRHPAIRSASSFSVAPGVRPRLGASLENIFTELVNDLALPRPTCGDLSPWAERGVLLLNRVLTVGPGRSGSPSGRGWEQVTDTAIEALARRGGPLVAVLWGRDARGDFAERCLSVACIESAPPVAALGASSGFFGSRPFSRANRLLAEQGASPMDWSLP